MKGPSSDAIRKFKEQQERRKREQEERKVQEKLTTLEHRAAQGDKKAKTQLKHIEKAQEDRKRPPEGGRPLEHKRHHNVRQDGASHTSRSQHSSCRDDKSSKALGHRKPKVAETNFEELMRLAKKNTNEVKISDKGSSNRVKKVEIRSRDDETKPELPRTRVDPRSVSSKKRHSSVIEGEPSRKITVSRPSASRPLPSKPVAPTRHVIQHRESMQRRPVIQQGTRRPHPPTPIRQGYYRDDDYYDDDEDEDEDEYESDGFVVNEEDDEVRDELQQTLKSVFRYDKRRCDLRERELDRQYRAIGNVSTFEDLEREERRASRLAASEDARALREEEERRHMKKMRRKALE